VVELPPPPRAGQRPPAMAAREGEDGGGARGENLIAPESPARDERGLRLQVLTSVGCIQLVITMLLIILLVSLEILFASIMH
jgi:hypothetical protein